MDVRGTLIRMAKWYVIAFCVLVVLIGHANLATELVVVP